MRVWPDRTPHPALTEVKFLWQSVRVFDADPKRKMVSVANDRDVCGLDDLECTWQLHEDGTLLESGTLDVSGIGPGMVARCKVPIHGRPSRRVDDGQLTFSFRLREATDWAPKGF